MKNLSARKVTGKHQARRGCEKTFVMQGCRETLPRGCEETFTRRLRGNFYQEVARKRLPGYVYRGIV